MESCSVRNAVCLQISPCAVGPFSLRLVLIMPTKTVFTQSTIFIYRTLTPSFMQHLEKNVPKIIFLLSPQWGFYRNICHFIPKEYVLSLINQRFVWFTFSLVHDSEFQWHTQRCVSTTTKSDLKGVFYYEPKCIQIISFLLSC